MPRSNTTCTESGIYRSECKDKEQIALSKNENFPLCGTCKQLVDWSLVRATEQGK